MSSFSESDLVCMVTLALMELSYRHKTTPTEMSDRFQVPEPYTLTIDESSGAEKLTLNSVGQAWRWLTGRSTPSRVISNAYSSRSKVARPHSKRSPVALVNSST